MLTILGGLVVLSIGAGFIGSISGLGGGVFIVPALVVFSRVPIQVAIGASLISVVATSAGASVAFVRDGWTNLRVAIVLECATVTGAITGAYLAGVVPPRILELLFAAIMLQSAYFSLRKPGDDIVEHSDPLAERLRLKGELPGDGIQPVIPYGVVNLPGGASLMVMAGLMSGMLGIGAGALKVMAMDYIMHLPLKVSSATSNFMIGVTAGAGALVFLFRGDVSTVIAGPVALGVTAGALAGSRVLPYADVRALRIVFVTILAADRGRDGLARAGGPLKPMAIAPNLAVVQDDEERLLRVWTPLILRSVLMVAVSILSIGLLRSVAAPGYYVKRFHELQRAVNLRHPADLERLAAGALNGDGRAIMTLGLMVLTLVPIGRVAFTLLVFAVEKDYAYVVMTAYVLAALIIGAALGRVG